MNHEDGVVFVAELAENFIGREQRDAVAPVFLGIDDIRCVQQAVPVQTPNQS
jgi:hypothetical protein